LANNNPDQIGNITGSFGNASSEEEYLEKNLSRQSREPTTNSTHMTLGPGIEPGTHWWEASTLTTGSSPFPRGRQGSFSLILFTLIICQGSFSFIPLSYSGAFNLGNLVKVWK